MQFIKKITNDITWVGVNDRSTKRFENMFTLPYGVAYNSYLVKDDKNVLFDSVDGAFTRLFLDNVEEALDGEDLDYIIVQHMEPDHCGNIDYILDRYPSCKFVGNAKTFKFFEQFYFDKYKDRYYEIKDGDELSTGKHNFKFYFAPMVHRPEVFMTYDTTDKLFFSADAFGAFNVHQGNFRASKLINSDIWMDEARRYYINIVGKQGQMVMNLFKKIEGLDINMILSLHGPVYDNKESIETILDKYQKWASFAPEEKGVLIVFSSMYGDTAIACDILASKLDDLGVEKIKVYDISDVDYSYVIADSHKYSNLVVAPINYNGGLYHKMDAYLRELMGTGFKNRHISFVNNGSWGGTSLKDAKEILSKGKDIEFVGEDLKLLSSLKENQLEDLESLARAIADDLKK